MTPIEVIRDQLEIYRRAERDWEAHFENRDTQKGREYAWKRMEEYALRRDVLEWVLGRIEREV